MRSQAILATPSPSPITLIGNLPKGSRRIANEIRKLADELELYTLTFMAALEENEEENKAVTTARSTEELRKALETI
ncbi:MAG: hypothetical protein AT713_02785 [Caldivirga sp. JCHS_4]|jgi:hypothetical protein|nr:MAG: hypothetical protein AT713_02785 [Caldivirga sp. JCHS_4]